MSGESWVDSLPTSPGSQDLAFSLWFLNDVCFVPAFTILFPIS